MYRAKRRFGFHSKSLYKAILTQLDSFSVTCTGNIPGKSKARRYCYVNFLVNAAISLPSMFFSNCEVYAGAKQSSHVQNSHETTTCSLSHALRQPGKVSCITVMSIRDTLV